MYIVVNPLYVLMALKFFMIAADIAILSYLVNTTVGSLQVTIILSSLFVGVPTKFTKYNALTLVTPATTPTVVSLLVQYLLQSVTVEVAKLIAATNNKAKVNNSFFILKLRIYFFVNEFDELMFVVCAFGMSVILKLIAATQRVYV